MMCLRDKAGRIGLVILDATTRTWGAFWGTLFVWAFYWCWNSEIPYDRFDPYPFVFLTLLITMASYLQNIVLMTDQRVAAIEMAKLHAREDARDAQMLHLLETLVATSEIIIQQARLSEAQDLTMMHIVEALHVHIKGSPFLDRSSPRPAEGSGIPGDDGPGI